MQTTCKLAVTQQERKKVFDFYRTLFTKRYNTQPSDLDSDIDLIYIMLDEKIVSCIGVDLKKSKKKIVLENMISIDKQSLPFAIDKFAFITRWASTSKRYGLATTLIASKYILNKGYGYGFSILKPRVAKYLNSYTNQSWIAIEDFDLFEEKIQGNDKNYFLNKPYPLPYFGLISKSFYHLNNHKLLESYKNLNLVNNY